MNGVITTPAAAPHDEEYCMWRRCDQCRQWTTRTPTCWDCFTVEADSNRKMVGILTQCLESSEIDLTSMRRELAGANATIKAQRAVINRLSAMDGAPTVDLECGTIDLEAVTQDLVIEEPVELDYAQQQRPTDQIEAAASALVQALPCEAGDVFDSPWTSEG